MFWSSTCPVAIVIDTNLGSGPILLQSIPNMAKKKKDLTLAEKERLAAQVLAASEGQISTAVAMKTIGFTSPERSESRKKRLYRHAQKIKVVSANEASTVAPSSASVSTPNQLDMANQSTQSISSLSAPPSYSPTNPNNQGPVTREQKELRRQLDDATADDGNDSVPVKVKKRRRSSQQKHLEDSKKNKQRKIQSAAVKSATTQIKESMLMSPTNPKKRSQRTIVSELNDRLGTNMSHKSVSRMVRDGKIGVSPTKPGPVGAFNKVVYGALQIAFLSYIKLEQAGGKSQSTVRDLSLRVNALVNYSGAVTRKGDDLAKRLKSDVADDLDIKRPNSQELRRILWTSYGNLNVWFTQWEHTVISLGFGRLKEPDGSEDDLEEGSVIFFEGQKKRILNLDETDGSLDNTKGKRGGRPPLVFYAKDISGGSTAASKSSYTPTIICGSNAAGEAIPPHFQLKSTAQSSARSCFSIEFIARCKDVWGTFGHSRRTLLPCTFGLNEKAGMNSVELDKYFKNSILPLYPDIEDIPGKRVIAKLDSGPGRMNLQMLAHLRIRGLYVVPGLPNSTGKTQETDQNYGPFKGAYRNNLHELARARFEAKKVINITDLPFLVFGGRDPETDIEMEDAFSRSFSKENCLSAWKKCGSVPLTRSPMEDKDIRHELVVNVDETINNNIDPQGSKLLQLQQSNHNACDFLTSLGYDGGRLRLSAPRRGAKKYELTQPQSKERVELLRKAKSAGQLFAVTHGEHLNSTDFFKARAIDERKKIADTMLKDKRTHYHRKKLRSEAMVILQQHGEPTLEKIKDYPARAMQKLYEWKLNKASKKAREDLLKEYLKAPTPLKDAEWTISEEMRLKELLTEDMYAKDTAIGVQLKQTAKAIANNIHDLDKQSRSDLLKVLQDREAEDPAGDNQRTEI